MTNEVSTMKKVLFVAIAAVFATPAMACDPQRSDCGPLWNPAQVPVIDPADYDVQYQPATAPGANGYVLHGEQTAMHPGGIVLVPAATSSTEGAVKGFIWSPKDLPPLTEDKK